MSHYTAITNNLASKPATWVITGVAGFIGSNLLETLLRLNQKVVGLDNFSTGYQHNLDDVQSLVPPENWANFSLVKGDIRDLATCQKVCKNVDYVLHQAALGSVPRSIEDPISTNENNISGFLNMLVAARDARVKQFVYAASSSTYGDHPGLPKIEENIGQPLSPYAITKYVNELYANIFSNTYGFYPIGLRYFNIFGRRQDPRGAYAAVIPTWFSGMLTEKPVYINGDGETSRDFCYIDNCVQANILAAVAANPKAKGQVYNVAFGERATLNELFALIRERVADERPHLTIPEPVYRDFRPGDVRHSLADITKAKTFLGYEPTHSVRQGLDETAAWYVASLG